jgi:hypothetical protein
VAVEPVGAGGASAGDGRGVSVVFHFAKEMNYRWEILSGTKKLL